MGKILLGSQIIENYKADLNLIATSVTVNIKNVQDATQYSPASGFYNNFIRCGRYEIEAIAQDNYIVDKILINNIEYSNNSIFDVNFGDSLNIEVITNV